MPHKQRRHLTKETLGKRIVRTCAFPTELRHLDFVISQVYEANKQEFEKHEARMEELNELYDEFTDNPQAFVMKYAKLDHNFTVMKTLEKNPDIFKRRYWL